MKCKLTPGLSSGDWNEFCSRFHFPPDDLPHIQAIYTALLPLVEAYAYEEFAHVVERQSRLYLTELSFLGDTYSLDLLPQIYGRLAPDGIQLTEGQMLRPLKTATLILHLDTTTHANLKQLCNTCANCRNFSCPSRKVTAPHLPHTYGAMQIFHTK